MAEAAEWQRVRRVRRIDLALGILGTVGILVAFAYAMLGGRSLDLAFIITTPLPILFSAARIALFATTVAYVAGMGIGFLVGWARTLRAPRREALLRGLSAIQAVPALIVAGIKRALRRVADFYVEVVRGTPLIIQIAFFFTIVLVFAPEEWSLGEQALVAGTLSLLVNTGGYQGEIFRGGLQAIQAGQIEAARATGFTRWGSMRHVLLPQAMRLIIPPLTNEFIALYKGSALLFVIGVQEATWWGQRLTRTHTTELFEIFIVLTAVYLLITIPLSRIIGTLERRFAIPGLGLGTAPREAVTLAALGKSETG